MPDQAREEKPRHGEVVHERAQRRCRLGDRHHEHAIDIADFGEPGTHLFRGGDGLAAHEAHVAGVLARHLAEPGFDLGDLPRHVESGLGPDGLAGQIDLRHGGRFVPGHGLPFRGRQRDRQGNAAQRNRKLPPCHRARGFRHLRSLRHISDINISFCSPGDYAANPPPVSIPQQFHFRQRYSLSLDIRNALEHTENRPAISKRD